VQEDPQARPSSDPRSLGQPAQPATPPTTVLPFEQEAVWALVLGIVSWFTCPVLGIAAFFIGGSALKTIRKSRYTVRGDGLAHAGRALGCLANLFWLLAILVIFGAFSLGAIGVNTFLHPSPSP
jgi:Domain of unknown function (DUF4190)